uniref:SNTX thioredoxin-like domain-containing protein n=1 Tax=Scleropages formosus TaxID=113540 RepID=A0A8C9R1A5_SCLFO
MSGSDGGVGLQSCSLVGLGFESCLGCLVVDWCPVLGVSPSPSGLMPCVTGAFHRTKVMEADSKTHVKVAALGRPFHLGMLYDCRSDSLVPGVTLWDPEDLVKDTLENSQHNTEFNIHASDSIENKSSALNIEASLKASFLGGLVEVGGSANFLKDTKTSKKQARVTLQYKTTTKFKQLSMNHFGRGNVKYPYVFGQGIATHVVTAILYGAQAFFVFDQEVSENEDHQNIEGNLQMMVEKINCFSVDGKGTLKMTDDDNAKAENFSCKFYGDFALENNPVSFQEAVKVYTMLPKLLGERGEHAVPVQIWLLPLTYLDSSATRVAHEISLGLVQETQTVLEELSGLQMQCNDLMNRNVTSHFPEIGTKVKDFKDMCLQYKSIFQTSLSEILPLIRGGGKGERELAEILKKKQQSLFNSNTLQKWLDSKEREIDILQIIIEVMKDTTMLTSEKAFDIEMFKSKAKYVVCFAFTSLNDKEPYLRHLSEYLKTLSGVNTVHTETERRQDAELPRWYFLKDVLDTMRRQVYLFVNFAEANKDSANAQFLSTSVSGSGHKGGKIYLYKDSKKQTDNFEPPSKPGKLRAIERTHDSNIESLWFLEPQEQENQL